MKSTFLAFIACAFFLSSLLSAQVPSNVTWVRVVHASPDAPAVDVLANGALVFQGMRFRNFTEYTPVPPGSYTFEVNLSGTSTTAVSLGPVNLRGGSAYTFYALGRVADSSLLIMGTGDDVTPPAAGMTKVRVVHGASRAPTVDVYATAPYAPLTVSPALTGVPFPLASGYLQVPAGVYQARVTPTGTKTVAIDSGRLPLSGASVRTVIALDPATSDGRFEILVIPDIN